MTDYPRTGYRADERISISARRIGGIEERRDYPLSRRTREDYEEDDKDKDKTIYGSRNKDEIIYCLQSKLPSLNTGYNHLKERDERISLDAFPVAVRSGVYSSSG